MATNPVRFRVEHNAAKSSFWYTIVAGNGNTTMTSKSKYDDYDNALRAARRQIAAITEGEIVLEYLHDGEPVEEVVQSALVGAVEATPGRIPRELIPGLDREPLFPTPSKAVFEANLNPQT